MTNEVKIRESALKKQGSLGELYDFLEEAFPQFRTRRNMFDVSAFARGIGLSRQAVFRWFDTEKIPQAQVKAILDLSEGRLTLDSLAIFILK